MLTIVANGLQTAYEVDGAGPPLVMLHGATISGREQFARLAPVLARGFRVYLPDARGHAGTAGDPADGWTTADLVADLTGFVDALGLGTFHLLGYSMGGMTALHFASTYPERLRTLVAISIGTEREPRLSVGRSLMDPDRIERDDPGWARSLAARHDPSHGTGAWRRLLTAIVQDIADQPLLTATELRAIDAPTLVVAGDRDPFVPVPQALALSRQVRNGRLLILPGVGHDVPGETTPLLEIALTEFYRSTEPVARERAGESNVTEAAR
ncbi:MAG TPA: alpha/beta hydrolase [Candidatus Limnocylindrales bacterium]|nr:alpha/beta hydrolase [Candidatus Limnocylindrales bacterium]